LTRRQKAPLRPLTALEQQTLERIGRSHTAAATPVARAKALLAVAAGHSYTTAARLAGRRSGDAVAHLVARFNHQGLSALEPRHGGGPPPRYGTPQRERILREVQRVPDREQDRTATWSLLTLRTALRKAPDGLPTVSTYTLWHVLREAGWTWQRSRTWCETGQVLRKRKHLWTIVRDRDAAAKKSSSNAPISWIRSRGCRSGVPIKLDRSKRCPIRGTVGSRKRTQHGSDRPTCAMARLNS
jgi:transposase